MMSEKQYRVARNGIVEQIKLAQKLHCTNLAKKHRAALNKFNCAFYNQTQQVVLIGEQGCRVVVIIYKLSSLWRERLEKPLSTKVRLTRLQNLTIVGIAHLCILIVLL